MIEKKELRQKLRAEIKTFHLKSRAQAVAQAVAQYPLFQANDNILAFMPASLEIPYFETLKRLAGDKQYWIPKISNPHMQYFQYNADQLKVGAFGILEPLNTKPFEDSNALVLVPGLAINQWGGRLGFGGGYFDRFLEKYPHFDILGINFIEFKSLEIPVESHDIKISDCIWG